MGRQGLSSRTTAGIIASVVVILDQVTKVWMVARVEGSTPINLIGDVLRFRVTRNPGAAFSTFTGSGVLIGFIAIGVAIFIVAIVGTIRHRTEIVALGLVLGGAIGNLIDRIFRGEGVLDGRVIDWIDLSFWPTFNVADSAITVGVILLLLSSFRRELG